MKTERKVKKSSMRKLERFCEKLEAFRVRTGDEVATLYEDAYTCFTLGNVRIENGFLLYEYDGVEECEDLLLFDGEAGEYYESECDGVGEYVKFWSACLRRAGLSRGRNNTRGNARGFSFLWLCEDGQRGLCLFCTVVQRARHGIL